MDCFVRCPRNDGKGLSLRAAFGREAIQLIPRNDGVDFSFVFRYIYPMIEELGRTITLAREEILDTWRHL